MFKQNNNNHKILTPDGYKYFEGIQLVKKTAYDVKFQSGKIFRCAKNHGVCVDLFNFRFEIVNDLIAGDFVFSKSGREVIESIVDVGIVELYDIVGVEDTVCYYTDGILSHNCEFINSGTSSMDETLYKRLGAYVKEPVEVLMDGKYKIYELPNPDKVYVVGVDTAEGVGGDYSVIKVLDITDLLEIIEVAEYYDNTIPVAEFSNKVYEILQHWGNPLVCIERNNQGGQVADRLGKDLAYPKIVNWGTKLAARKSLELLGMVSSRNTKYHAVANARYYYSDKAVILFRNQHTLDELFKDFVKVNDTWQAASGKHDDRTMALVWALMVLDPEVCERWFSIEEVDDCGKPLKISPLDHGVSFFENPTSIYTNEQVEKIENSNLSPVSFGGGSEQTDEISGYLADGWTFLGGRSANHDNQDYDNDFDKYF